MAKTTLDKQTKKAILDAKTMIEACIRSDANEADTGMRIERMFESIMGYDVFKHLTHEHAVHGVGDTQYCDYAIQLDEEKKIPTVLIEIKRATTELASRHLKQTASYAINIGCEWAILTNGKIWQLYHISFGQPPQTVLLDSWDLIEGDTTYLADKFNLIGYKNVKRGGLRQVWEKSNVLTPENILKILLSEESISMVRRGLKRATDINVTPDEIVGAFRHLFNESALAEMAKIKICLPERKQRKSATDRTETPVVETKQVISQEIKQ